MIKFVLKDLVAMAECSKCKTAIRGETGVRCSGVCDKVYHCTVKCAGLDQYAAGILDKGGFVRFICDDCLEYIHNMDMLLKEVQDNVKRNRQSLVAYGDGFNESLKRSENEIKILLEAIEKRYDDRFKKMDSVQKSCERNMQEVNKLVQIVGDYENTNKEMYNEIEKSNTKMCNEIKKVIKDTNIKTNKMSYAQTVKENPVMPDVSKQVPLILRPKERQGIDKTKEELNKNVDPVNLKITNVENRRNGTLVIQSENVEERDKIKSAIQSGMGDNYDVRVPNPIDMHIVITDMNFRIDEKEIVDKLKKQNQILENSEIKIVKLFETKRFNRKIYNAKVKVDNEVYKKIISEKRIKVGWDICRVFDGTSIIQCYKCKGYNHKAVDCQNQETCYKCHGNHNNKECNKEVILKCINCIRANKNLNLELDENHLTNDRECPVYKNKLNMKMRMMGLVA